MLLAVHTGNGEAQSGCAASVAVTGLTQCIHHRRLHNSRGQPFILHNLKTHAHALTAPCVVHSDEQGNRCGKLTLTTTDAAGAVLRKSTNGLAHIAHLIAALHIGNNTQNPCLSHKNIALTPLHKGMTKGQHIALIISPGHSAQRSQCHIALQNRGSYGAAGLQGLTGALTHAHGAHSL